MLDFILSKLNLLILVTAIFAIVVFFTFSLNDTFIVQKANEIADSVSAQATALISSPSYCAKNIIVIPKDLSFLGGRKAFYKLEISTVALDAEKKLYGLKFTLLDRRNESKVFASTRMNVTAEGIYLYSLDTAANTAIVDTSSPRTSIIVDPQSVAAVDAFVLVKEVSLGKNYIIAIPCTSSGGSCYRNANDVVEKSETIKSEIKNEACIGYSGS